MGQQTEVIVLDNDDDAADEKENIVAKAPLEASKTSGKESRSATQEQIVCMICMDGMAAMGPHRAATLRCGHIFGSSCIREWLVNGAGNNKRCPKCNKKARVDHVVPLYDLPQVASTDAAYTADLEAKLAAAERERLRVEKEKAAAAAEAERTRQEVVELRRQLQRESASKPSQWHGQYNHGPHGALPQGNGSTSSQPPSQTVAQPHHNQYHSRSAAFQQGPVQPSGSVGLLVGPSAGPHSQAQLYTWQPGGRQTPGDVGMAASQLPTANVQAGTQATAAAAPMQPAPVPSRLLPPLAAAGANPGPRLGVAGVGQSEPGPASSSPPPSASVPTSTPTFTPIQSHEIQKGKCFDFHPDTGMLLAAEHAAGPEPRLRRVSALVPQASSPVRLPPGTGCIRDIRLRADGSVAAVATGGWGLMLLSATSGSVVAKYPGNATCSAGGGAWSCAWSGRCEHELYLGLRSGQVALVDTRILGADAVCILATLPGPTPVLTVLPVPPASSSSSSNGSGSTDHRPQVGGWVVSGTGNNGGGNGSSDSGSGWGDAWSWAHGGGGGAAGGATVGCEGGVEVVAASTSGVWGVGRGCLRPLDTPSTTSNGTRVNCESLVADAATGALAVSWRTGMGALESVAGAGGAYHSLFMRARAGGVGEGLGSTGSSSVVVPYQAPVTLSGHTSSAVWTRGTFMHAPQCNRQQPPQQQQAAAAGGADDDAAHHIGWGGFWGTGGASRVFGAAASAAPGPGSGGAGGSGDQGVGEVLGSSGPAAAAAATAPASMGAATAATAGLPGAFFVSGDEAVGEALVWCLRTGGVVARLPQQPMPGLAVGGAWRGPDRVLQTAYHAGSCLGQVLVTGSERCVRMYKVGWQAL